MKYGNLKLDFPEDFFEAEIRNGYEVTEETKKIWAVQLDLFKELERVCEKYNLKLFADAGTLLGVVRSQQYIPWDDDIDFIMTRADYEKLVSIADKEFEHPYFFQTAYNDDHCFRGHAQFRNSETTGMVKIDKGMPYNKGIFIDIVPLDNVPDGKLARKILRFRALACWSLLLLSYYNPTIMDKRPYAKFLCAILKPFYKIVDYRKVYHHYEMICRSYEHKHTKKQTCLGIFQCKITDLVRYDTYDTDMRMKFEFTDILVPGKYKEVLRSYYGKDYMTPAQAPAHHGDVFFDTEKSYKEYDRMSHKSKNKR